jgi:hypothetical protein
MPAALWDPIRLKKEQVRGVFVIGALAALYYVRGVFGTNLTIIWPPEYLQKWLPTVTPFTLDPYWVMGFLATYVLAIAIALADDLYERDWWKTICSFARVAGDTAFVLGALMIVAVFVTSFPPQTWGFLLAVALLANWRVVKSRLQREWMHWKGQDANQPLEHPLDPKRKTEMKFHLLLRDLGGNASLSLYGMSFSDKLVGAKLTYSLCKEATERLAVVFQEEKASQKTGVVSKVGTPMAHAATHFESFLYFIMGALDILASITVYFYPKDKKTLSKQVYFKDQMNRTYLKHPNINRDYAALLRENKQWIEDVGKNRDGLAHKASAFLAFEKDGRVVFEKREPYDDNDPLTQKEFEDLLAYLDTTLGSFYRFLDSYVRIHRMRVPVSDQTKMMLENLEKGLVKEYYP